MEGLGKVGWNRGCGCEGVSGDVDGDGMVAACSGDQAFDGLAQVVVVWVRFCLTRDIWVGVMSLGMGDSSVSGHGWHFGGFWG